MVILSDLFFENKAVTLGASKLGNCIGSGLLTANSLKEFCRVFGFSIYFMNKGFKYVGKFRSGIVVYGRPNSEIAHAIVHIASEDVNVKITNNYYLEYEIEENNKPIIEQKKLEEKRKIKKRKEMKQQRNKQKDNQTRKNQIKIKIKIK